MVQLWGRTWTRAELTRRCGDLSQLGGMRPFAYSDGPAKGAAGLDLSTGAGLRLTIALDRGMDISEASFNGKSLCWRSCTGDKHPAHFQHGGLEWLRHFYGGLVLTCGLTQAGAPCRDGESGEELGIHGRYTALPAARVRLEEGWEGDDYVMRARGAMRDAVVFFEHLELERTIEARLGERRFLIEDRVTNRGFEPAPFMLLYHCNFGFPVVDRGARLLVAAATVQPRDPAAQRGVETATRFDGPTPHYKEQCFFYDMLADENGDVTAAIVNDACDGGFGVYIRYPKTALPWFTQWKMTGEGNYTCGLEPGNCLPVGREEWRRRGLLRMLAPGEEAVSRLEFGCLVGGDEIAACEEALGRLTGGKPPRVLPRASDAELNR